MIESKSRLLAKVASTMILASAASACQRSSNEQATATQQAAILYADACLRCHGTNGHGGRVEGSKAQARDFTDGAYQSTRTDEQFREAIVNGTGNMPAFRDDYNAQQIDGLIRLIRGFKENPAP